MKRVDYEHRRHIVTLPQRLVLPQILHIVEMTAVHGGLGEDLRQHRHVAETQIHALTGQGMDSVCRVP